MKVNMYKKKIVPDSPCPLCSIHPESTRHILWECASSTAIWMECPCKIQKLSLAVANGLHLFMQLFKNLEEDDLLLVSCLAHKTWLRRNAVIFGGKIYFPAHLVHSTANSPVAFHQAQLSSPMGFGSPARPVRQVWQRPPVEVSKLNWDASLNKETRTMGVRVIIRDAEGLVLASLCSIVPFIMDPTIVEAIVAWKAVELCHALGLQRVIMEGDALAVAKGLRQEAPSWCQYFEDTQSILNSLPFWKATHVCREANGAAHGLAQAALNQFLDCI